MDDRTYQFTQSIFPINLSQTFIDQFAAFWDQKDFIGLRRYAKEYLRSEFGEEIESQDTFFWASLGAEISYKYSDYLDVFPINEFLSTIQIEMQNGIEKWGWGWFIEWNDYSAECAEFIFNNELYPQLKDRPELEKYIYPYITLTLTALYKDKTPITKKKLLEAEKLVIEQVRDSKTSSSLLAHIISHLFLVGFKEEAYQITKRNDFYSKWKYLLEFPKEFEENRDKTNEILYLGLYIVEQSEHFIHSLFEQMQRFADTIARFISQNAIKDLSECKTFIEQKEKTNLNNIDDLVRIIKNINILIDDLAYRHAFRFPASIVNDNARLNQAITNYYISEDNLNLIKTKVKQMQNQTYLQTENKLLSYFTQIQEESKDQYRDLSETIQDNFSSVNTNLGRIEHKIDDVTIHLAEVLSKLNTLQDDTTEKLRSAVKEDEIERILHNHSERILLLIQEEYKERMIEEYAVVESKLKRKFGVHWELLSDDSKLYLVTSRITYNDFSKHSSNLDYSPVCIPLTKALEKELFDRFFRRYKYYLTNTIGKRPGRDLFPKGLVRELKDENGKIFRSLQPDRYFTLGSIPYIFGINQNKIVNHKIFSMLIEYCKKEIFNDWYSNDKEIQTYLIRLNNTVDKISKEYRNEAAHKNQLNKNKAEKCYDEMLKIEKILVDFISKTKHHS